MSDYDLDSQLESILNQTEKDKDSNLKSLLLEALLQQNNNDELKAKLLKEKLILDKTTNDEWTKNVKKDDGYKFQIEVNKSSFWFRKLCQDKGIRHQQVSYTVNGQFFYLHNIEYMTSTEINDMFFKQTITGNTDNEQTQFYYIDPKKYKMIYVDKQTQEIQTTNRLSSIT